MQNIFQLFSKWIVKWNQPQPQLCVIFIRKRFPFILPETTLSKVEATLNYLQTFTRESIFQYGMNYEVNFQIKNEMTCIPSSLSFILRTGATLNKVSLYSEVRVISFKCSLLIIRGTHTCLRILSKETTLYWKLRVH